MGEETSFTILAVVCGMVLFITLLKRRSQFLLAFVVRMILGAAAIFLINDLLAEKGIMVVVGLNPLSLLTAGALGISGVALLYGIVACKFL